MTYGCREKTVGDEHRAGGGGKGVGKQRKGGGATGGAGTGGGPGLTSASTVQAPALDSDSHSVCKEHYHHRQQPPPPHNNIDTTASISTRARRYCSEKGQTYL